MVPRVNFEALTSAGCKLTVVSTLHLADLKSELENRLEQKQFHEAFANEYMFRFKFGPPEGLKNVKSIIVVAMPRPATQAVFNWNRKRHVFILPPTYTAYDEKRVHVEQLAAEAVVKKGYRTATLNLPLKLLAVCSGLAQYGRNNIAYVQGMGSFMRLTAVYSDMPCESGDWHDAKVMDRCADCGLCQNACPTGAIAKDRFLLRAERCLTYHNEKEGKIPFPDWIKPEWHNCIVGCIRCQAVCPENKPFLGQVGGKAEFSEKETRLLLKGTSREQIPPATMKKMNTLGLMDYFNEMPRNLSALLKTAKT